MKSIPPSCAAFNRRLTEVPTNLAPVFICPICGAAHSSAVNLVACMAATEQPVWKVGDLVMLNSTTLGCRNEAWIIDREGFEFHGEKSPRVVAVVAAVTSYAEASGRRVQIGGEFEAHKLAYHVIINPEAGDAGRIGWTTATGSHITPQALPAGFKPSADVIEARDKVLARVAAGEKLRAGYLL